MLYRIKKFTLILGVSFLGLSVASCAKKVSPPTEEQDDKEAGSQEESKVAAPVPSPDLGEEGSVPFIYIHKIQWHEDFRSNPNQAGRYLLADPSISDVYQDEKGETDKGVFPMALRFYKKRPSAGSQLVTVFEIEVNAFLTDHYAKRVYSRTLEVPNGCEVLYNSGIAPPEVQQALTGCIGERFMMTQFPFPEDQGGPFIINGEDNVFGAVGSIPRSRDEIPVLRQTYQDVVSQSVLKIETGRAPQDALDIPLDTMMSADGLAFSGVLVFRSLDRTLLSSQYLDEIIDSHLEFWGYPTPADVAYKEAIKSDPHFVVGSLDYVQFRRSPKLPHPPYPPLSPVTCTHEDWIRTGRNMLSNGCSTPHQNCKGPEGSRGNYAPYVGQCEDKEITLSNGRRVTIKGVNFDFVDETASKSDAFMLAGFFVKKTEKIKEGDLERDAEVWYLGDFNTYQFPECEAGRGKLGPI